MKHTEDKDIGPIQLLAVAFSEPNFSGEIRRELKKLRDNGSIRIVDSIVVLKDSDGNVTELEESDLTSEENREYGQMIGGLIGMGSGDTKVAKEMGTYVADEFNSRYEYGLDKEDIELLAGEIPKGDAAMVLLIEHTWAQPIRNAVRKAGGMLLAQDFLSPELLLSIGSRELTGSAA